jgi:hypothetical protein
MINQPGCYYCDRQRGGQDAPPGGWLIDDDDWRVGHGPAHMCLPGSLRIESRRHFTDFAEMTDPEAASFGRLLAPCTGRPGRPPARSASTWYRPWTSSHISTPGSTREQLTSHVAGLHS